MPSLKRAMFLRFQCVLLVAMFASIALPHVCMAQSLERLKQTRKKWTGSNGKVIDATLMSADLDSFVLKVGQKEMKLTYDKLEQSEALALKIAYLDQQDFLQFEKVKDKLPSIQERSKTVADLLIQIQKDHPDSPYAGLWAVVALSAGLNEHEKAERWATTTIKCIEAQRKVGDARHETTLCSAFNNLAILQLKAKKGDAAGSALLRALNSREVIPFIVNHNTQQLLQIADKEKTLVKLSDRSRTALTKKMASLPSAAPGSIAVDGWHYSLDFDIPAESVAARKVDGVDAPISGLELSSMGTGVVVAPGIVLTTSSLVKDLDGLERKLLTVTAPDSSNVTRSYRVQSVYTSRLHARARSGGNINLGDGFGSVTFTTFDFIEPKSGTAEAEICALNVPGLATHPVVFNSSNAAANLNITVFGYHRGADALAQGVQKWDGTILQPVNNARQAVKGSMNMSVPVEGGTRGGPLMLSDGSVVGMAFGASEDSSGGIFFPVSTIRKWFGDFVKTSDLTYLKPNMSAEELTRQTENATVPIFAWGIPEASDTKVYSKFVDASQVGGMAIVDNWCITCDGDGHMRCPNPSCSKGYIMDKKVVSDGRNPISGQALWTETATASKCNVCRGTGYVDCPHCQEGMLRTSNSSRRSR